MASDRERTQQGERLPPQAPDVERTVLGSMLLDGNAVALAMEKLDEQVFYLSSHRHIFTCMVELFSKDTPVDIVTLADALRKKGLLEAVGAEAYLGELVENVATSANIEYYAEILREKATLRGLITAASEIATDAFAAEAEADAILDRSERRIFSIKESRIKKGVVRIGELLPATFKEIEDYSRGGVQGIPTGFKELDEKTTGLQKGDLIIVAGRPSMGKTAFALSMALHAGVRARKAVAVFSLEMSRQQVAQRMLCSEARVDMHRLRSGTLPKGDFPKLSLAAGPLHDAPIYVDDTPGISVLEIRAKARRLKAQGVLDLVIVDYLQLMSSTMRIESRQQEISQISRSLKGLAKELEVPVVTLSQLSRAVEQRGGDHRPQLSDLRESGAIEQDADVVLFVFRPGYYDHENQEIERVAEVIIGKQRNGPTGDIKLTFMREYVRFENPEMHQETGF
jgi:replicative DNA helicase